MLQGKISSLIWGFCVLTIFTAIFLTSASFTSAETKLEDGIYDIEYEVLTAEVDEVSIANDYFDKPATLIVDGDKRWLQIKVNHAHWVKELQTPEGNDFEEVDILEENPSDDIRIVQFNVDGDYDFSNPMEIKMHIVVDELEEDYDHHYTTFFDFDENSAIEAEEPLAKHVEDADKQSKVSVKSNNEVTNQGMNNKWIILSIVGCFMAIFILFLVKQKNKKK